VYKNELYEEMFYQENERWTDGCKYDCVCIDGLRGRY
jgi:hypothetical protein